jgi:tetratricopeptide (TPR) repeat protein
MTHQPGNTGPSEAPVSAPGSVAAALGRRRIWAALVLAALGAGGGWLWWRGHAAPEPPAVVLDQADPVVRDAVTAARAEVVKAPRSSAAWGKLGMVLRVYDFADAAVVAFAQAARLDPEEPRWPYLLGRSLHRTPEKAVPYLQTAVGLCGVRPLGPLLKLAETLLELGQLDEAEELYRRASRAAPTELRSQDAQIQLGMARVAMAREQWEMAIDHLQRCTASPFARQQALNLLAAAYGRLPGRSRDADIAAAQAQLPPDDLDFSLLDPFMQEVSELGNSKNQRLTAAILLKAEGRRDQAVAQLQKLTLDYPDDVWPQIKLAEAQLGGGDFAGAASAAQAALTRDPKAAQAHFYLGAALFHLADESCRRTGQTDTAQLQAAIRSLRRATELKPGHGYAYNYLGQALRLDQRPREACRAYLDALRCYPGFVDPHLHLAELWIESGWVAPAFFHLQQATVFALPDDGRSRRILSQTMLRWCWGKPR